MDVNTMTEDSQGQDISSWALGDSLREIFSYLPTRDLLTCSVVNKTWNYEARSMLRDNRSCIAYISGPKPCVDLLNLNNQMARMTVVPYNGLKINTRVLEHSASTSCVGNRQLLRNYNFLLIEFNLKYLEITNLDRSTECPLDDLTARLITRKYKTLKELVFGCVPRVFRLEPTLDVQFTALRILNLSPDSCEPFALEIFSNIDATAPNLEEIWGGMNIEDLKFLPPSKYFLVKDLLVHRYPQEHDEAIDLEALRTLRLYELNVNVSIHHDSPKCWEMIGIILASSRSSLKILRIGACSLLNLVRTNSVPECLDNLDSVYLGLVPYWFDNAAEVQIRTIARGLDFARLFPKLRSVSLIDDHPHGFYTDCYCCMNDQEGQARSTETVECLCDCYYLLSPLTFQHVSQMFPNVRTFESVNAYPDQVRCYEQVWRSWGSNNEKWLETACLSFECRQGENYDGLFCGIEEEEVKWLQSCNEDFLRKVHIVPTKPAVTNLIGLQKLVLTVSVQDEDGPEQPSDPNMYFLSRVTGLVAFNRMPGLQVNLTTMRNFGVFSHLVRYINVIYEAEPR